LEGHLNPATGTNRWRGLLHYSNLRTTAWRDAVQRPACPWPLANQMANYDNEYNMGCLCLSMVMRITDYSRRLE
jgi:hypothetical protein